MTSRRLTPGRARAALLAVLCLALLVSDQAAAAPVPVPVRAEPGGVVRPDFDTVAELDELTDDHASIFRLYRAYFDREPDVEGALYWIEQHDRCFSLTAISNQFVRGDEFRRRYGALDDGGFLDLVYRNVLGRGVEKAGRDYWLGQLASGRTTRGGVMLHISLGKEFRSAHPHPSDGVPSRSCRPTRDASTPRVFSPAAPRPFARAADAGGLVLWAPAMVVERLGFHQSTHPGAMALRVVGPTTFPRSTMESRGRGTALTGAADIVVHPSVPIHAPVSGIVRRAGEYTLYCRHTDGFVVINPDERPELEVKLLHVRGVTVESGDRIEVGDRIAAGATPFPFRSQIDELTAEPSWPHVHIEVVDPSVPRRPGSGSC